MNCATCKYWGSPSETKRLDVRSCQAIEHDTHGCFNQTLEDYDYLVDLAAKGDEWAAEELSERRTFIDALAVVQDGSGYMATLYTRSAFGCVLWEAV